MNKNKQDLLNYYISIFGEIPNIKEYSIFVDNNINETQILDFVNKTYQNNHMRQPTETELRNAVDELINNTKINKTNFTELIICNKLVSKVFLINLARRQDRLKNVSKKLEVLQINYERFDAIDGQSISIRDEWINLLENGSKISSPGAYGCLLSHLTIIKMAKEQNLKSILIFEDDIIFHKNFANKLRKLNSVPDDANIIYLGASQFKTSTPKNFVNNNCYKANDTFGTFAYIIKDTIYDVLINILEKRQQDIDYSLCAIQKHFNSYVIWENIVIADLSSSDIRTENHSYDTFGWNIRNYNFGSEIETTVVIGNKTINTIDDAISDINNANKMTLHPGYSFLIRAKNEELLVESCIESIVDIADEIIFVDNNSTDNTLAKINEQANKYNNISVYQYNIDVPKAGKIHETNVENGSLNTLATYYNWCLSKVTRYNVIKWDCDFIAIRENLKKLITNYNLETRSDRFGIWFTGKTLFYGKYLRETDFYDEFRVFSKKNGFYWDNYKGCETSAYYVWSLGTAYINGCDKLLSDIRFKNLDEYKQKSPPVFFEVKNKGDIKINTNILDSRDNKDNEILLKFQLSDDILVKNISSIISKNHKILITIPSLTVGGGNLWVINIYRALIELGFDVKIYCNYISQNTSDNVYLDNFDQRDIIYNMSPDKVYNYIINNEIEYVIQTTTLLWTEHLISLKGKVFQAILTHSDVSYINNYIYKNRDYFDKVIVVNNKTIQKFSDYGINNTAFLTNYISDINYCKHKKQSKKFGIISRLSTDKNLIMTLFAFKNMISTENYKGYTLHIVGDDCEKTMNLIKYYIHKLDLVNYVVLYGYQKNVVDYYNLIDAVVLPSVSEGCPYNLLEAALTGTPIVCSKVGGNFEIVGNHAVVFDLEGAEEVSRNVLYVNSYDDHLESIGYKIMGRRDGISVCKDCESFDIVPACDCVGVGNENIKLGWLLDRWNKNVLNIVGALREMADNYEYYVREREKLMVDILKRFSSKSVFVNGLVGLLGIDLEMISG